jgi:hypothetical protein
MIQQQISLSKRISEERALRLWRPLQALLVTFRRKNAISDTGRVT